MVNHSCQSDSVLLWKAIATGHNDILELISTILDELLELNGKFLLCCDETNANLEHIINQLDVLIQNLIDCCEGICDRLDTIIEILEEKYPEGVEYGITYDDYICVEEWDCDVGGEFLECNFEDCLPEPPEIEYEVTWDEYVCVEEPATTTTTTQVGTTSTTTVSETTSTTTILPTTTTTEEPTTTTTTIIEPQTDYGYLYNWWAAIGDTDGDDSADTSIANTGWHLPTVDEFYSLLIEVDPGCIDDVGENIAGGKMKETGYTYWDSPNTGATNEVGFSARGGALRGTAEIGFVGLKMYNFLWSADERSNGLEAYSAQLEYNSSKFVTKADSLNSTMNPFQVKEAGFSIRLIKDATDLEDGETGTYTGNNGITYPTICIGTQEWLACNLEETKFRDGTDIPYIDNEDAGDDAEWAAATSAAYCIYPIT